MGYVVFQFPLGFSPSDQSKEFVEMVRGRLMSSILMCVEFRDRRWFQGGAMEETVNWLTSINCSLIAVEELHHELYGQPRPNDPVTAQRRQLPIPIFPGHTCYIRVHRREGNEQQRVLPPMVVDEWANKHLAKLLPVSQNQEIAKRHPPTSLKDDMIYMVFGTDALDAPVISTNEIIKRLPPRVVYDWKGIIKNITNTSGLGAFGFKSNVLLSQIKSMEESKDKSNQQSIPAPSIAVPSPAPHHQQQSSQTPKPQFQTAAMELESRQSKVDDAEDNGGIDDDDDFASFEEGKEDLFNEQRVVALVDLDCFYVEVERRKNPALKGVPVAVVQYTLIIALSYEAKKCGVKRGKSTLEEAKKLCPDIQFVKVEERNGKAVLDLYRNASREVMQIIKKFASVIERASIDEVFIDLSKEANAALQAEKDKETQEMKEPPMIEGTGQQYVVGSDDKKFTFVEHGDKLLLHGAMIVNKIRAAIREGLGYSCSSGIAHNKSIAKYACGMHKPNAQTIVPTSAVKLLLEKLPITRVRYFGGKLGHSLETELHLTTVADLRKHPETFYASKFGTKDAKRIYLLSKGICIEPVRPRTLPKSYGVGKNFRKHEVLRTLEDIRTWISRFAMELSCRIEDEFEINGRYPRTINIRWTSYSPERESVSKQGPIYLANVMQPLSAESASLAVNSPNISDPICIAAEALFISVLTKNNPDLSVHSVAINNLSIVLSNMTEPKKSGKSSIDYFLCNAAPASVSAPAPINTSSSSNQSSSSFGDLKNSSSPPSSSSFSDDVSHNPSPEIAIVSTPTKAQQNSSSSSSSSPNEMASSTKKRDQERESGYLQPDSKKQKKDLWSCLECGFSKNDSRFLRCEECGQRKGSMTDSLVTPPSRKGPSASSTAASTTTINNTSSSSSISVTTTNAGTKSSTQLEENQPQFWSCPSCTFKNELRWLRCEMCDTAKSSTTHYIDTTVDDSKDEIAIEIDEEPTLMDIMKSKPKAAKTQKKAKKN